MRLYLGLLLLNLTFGWTSCKSTGGQSSVKENGGTIDVEQGWAKSLSDDLSAARDHERDLSESRSNIAEAGGADEIAPALLDHLSRISGITQEINYILYKMTDKLSHPQVKQDVTNVAQVSNDAFNGVMNDLNQLSAPSGGLLDSIRNISAVYSLAVLDNRGRPDPIKRAKVTDIKRQFDTQLAAIDTKLKSVIDQVNGWVISATGRGSIAPPVQPQRPPVVIQPPTPTGPVLVSREFLCKPLDERYQSLENDLYVKLRFDNNDVKVNKIESFSKKEGCSARAAFYVSGNCKANASCNFILCMPNDPRYLSLEIQMKHYVMAEGSLSFVETEVNPGYSRDVPSCAEQLGVINSSCPNLARCNVKLCAPKDFRYKSLEAGMFNLVGNGADFQWVLAKPYGNLAQCKADLDFGR